MHVCAEAFQMAKAGAEGLEIKGKKRIHEIHENTRTKAS